MPVRALAMLLLMTSTLSAARAEGSPLTLPARDVDVTYELTRQPPGPPQERQSQRVRWDAASQRMRVDTPSPGLYVVMDYRSHVLSAVRPAERMVLEMKSDGAGFAPAGVAAAGSYVRQGDSVVASLPCTEWRTADAAGQMAVVCLTEDGVLLRVRIGQTALVEAVRVTYGAMSGDVFEVPGDFRRVAAPDQRR